MTSAVSVLDFGAVGDGITDDYPAIQAALDAVGNSGGSTVILPKVSGRYLISQGLKIPSHVTLEGCAPARYPFNAGNANSSALVAKFSDPFQWIIEPKTQVAQQSVPYNVMVTGGAQNDFTINCCVRNLVITSLEFDENGDRRVVPYGGIRMHGCPGSIVENVAIDNVGCGLLVNFSTGGSYVVHTLTHYYGVACWEDANANSFDVYATRKDPSLGQIIPNAYLMPFMSALDGGLISEGLSTNSHYNRPFGLVVGATGDRASVNSSFDVTIENFSGGVFQRRALAMTFGRLYVEGAPPTVDIVVVAARSAFNAATLHAYISAAPSPRWGSLFDIGNEVTARIAPNGMIFPESFGTVSLSDTTSIVLEGVKPSDGTQAVDTGFTPGAPLQQNIFYGESTPWHPLANAVMAGTTTMFLNSWSNVGGISVDAAYRLQGNTGAVQLRGFITGGPSGTAAFTLPMGFRPFKRRAFTTVGGDVVIDMDGTVTVYTTGGTVGLDGIGFDRV
ncbi:glycoside hydrolase family 55 protein [Sphingomonas sp. QA11]|uniref:glycosyl hydrolase family 28-related protein n=1 Tax=Sphingomonas sp. QA11 TaxID=2950605 RepID=UPI0023491E56|nr:glycosyl hydrolase family 28-related protein [Sphingomonas sp. QA11]WCM26287.1 glycoside hydrolase family 55 protein [Sphingomonas sp. QA11]